MRHNSTHSLLLILFFIANSYAMIDVVPTYYKINSIDSSAMPSYGWIVNGPDSILFSNEKESLSIYRHPTNETSDSRLDVNFPVSNYYYISPENDTTLIQNLEFTSVTKDSISISIITENTENKINASIEIGNIHGLFIYPTFIDTLPITIIGLAVITVFIIALGSFLL